MIDVSILLPTFQSELTIGRAIRSCLDQPGVNVQVVVVDDGSTDNTLRRVNRFDDERIDYTYQKNSGLVAALKTASHFAKGRYVIRLDSDDWLEARSLKRMVVAMDAGAGFCYGQIKYYGRRSDTYTPPPFDASAFNVHNASGYPVMYRREALDSIGYEMICDTVPGLEDWDFNLALVNAGYKGLALRDTLVLHYILQHRSMMSVSKAGEADLMNAFRAKWPQVTQEVMP